MSTIYIAVGPFCWGRDKTIKGALQNAKKNFPGRSVARNIKKGEPCYRVFEVHPDSYVSEMGGITHPQAHPPKMVGAFTISLKGIPDV